MNEFGPTPFGGFCQAYWLIKNTIIGETISNRIIPKSGPNNISDSPPLQVLAQTQIVLHTRRG